MAFSRTTRPSWCRARFASSRFFHVRLPWAFSSGETVTIFGREGSWLALPTDVENPRREEVERSFDVEVGRRIFNIFLWYRKNLLVFEKEGNFEVQMRLQRVVIYPPLHLKGDIQWRERPNASRLPRLTRLFGKGERSISPLSSEFITSTSGFHIVESHYPMIITLVSGREERNLGRRSSGVKL